MKRIFFIIPILLVALLGVTESQPEIEMREIGSIGLPKNPQCTFYRVNSDGDPADLLLTAYHHGPQRVIMGIINPHITSFSGFSETIENGQHIWTAGAGRKLTLQLYSRSWTSRFFGHSLKLELSETSKTDDRVNYSGTMRVARMFKSETIDINGSCEE